MRAGLEGNLNILTWEKLFLVYKQLKLDITDLELCIPKHMNETE